MLDTILDNALPIIASAVLALLGWLIKLGVSRFKTNTVLVEVLEGIRVGMNEVYNDVILPKLERARASDSPEGAKITAEERKEMLRDVWEHLMNTLKGPALVFVKDKGFAWVSAKVEDILLSIKSKASESKPDVALLS